MKEINPSRFKKVDPNDLSDFQAEPIRNKPPIQAAPVLQQRIIVAPNDIKRTDVRTVHHIVVPQKRVRIRHAFEIFEDQLEAFKKIQSAHRDTHGNNGTPSLSDMVREAFDSVIRERVKVLKNIDISNE